MISMKKVNYAAIDIGSNASTITDKMRKRRKCPRTNE